MSLRHARDPERAAGRRPRRVPRDLGRPRVPAGPAALLPTAGRLMITTYVASKVARAGERGGPVSRTAAVTGRNLIAIRHSAYWLVVISGLLEPLLYLFSIGIGVGQLIPSFTLP